MFLSLLVVCSARLMTNETSHNVGVVEIFHKSDLQDLVESTRRMRHQDAVETSNNLFFRIDQLGLIGRQIKTTERLEFKLRVNTETAEPVVVLFLRDRHLQGTSSRLRFVTPVN